MTKYERDLRRIQKKPLSIEEIKWYRSGVQALPNALFQCKNLKRLDVERNNLEILPEEIGQLENLEELNLATNCFTSLPTALLTLKKLRKLEVRSNSIHKFPTFLLAHPTLEVLDLKLNKISEIPDFSTENTALKFLSVSSSNLQSITPSLQNLKALETLEVAYGNLPELPIELGNLVNLKKLAFEWNPVTELPICLKSLSQLTALNFNKTNIIALPNWVREKEKLVSIAFNSDPSTPNFDTFPPQLISFVKTAQITGLGGIYPNLNYKDSNRLWKQLKERKGTAEDDLRYIHLFTGDERMTTHPIEKIIADVKATKEVFIAQNAIQALTKETLIQHPLQSGSELVLLGKLDLKDVRTVKKRLKEAGISFVKSPTASSTHWYISSKINGDFQTDYAHLPFVNSEQLLNALDELVPQYLVEDKENLSKNVENIKRFLFASDESSQQLAFELIKSGGLPKELLTDVYYLFQTSENPKIATKARNVVKKYASPQLLKGMQIRQKIKNIYNKQNQFSNYWKQAVVGTELDDLRILYYMVRDFGTQLCYAMHPLMNHPNAQPEEIVKYAGEKGKLQLRGEQQAKLIEHFSVIPNLEELELWGMKFEELPKEIYTLKALNNLYLNEVSIAEISVEITKLSSLQTLKLKLWENKKLPQLAALSLQELHIASNYQGDLSPVLKGLKTLKRLVISGNPSMLALPKGLESCENLEYLKLHCANLSELSDALLPLQNLKELVLDSVKLEEFPMVLTKLSALRKIEVNSYWSGDTYKILKENQHLLHPQLVL